MVGAPDSFEGLIVSQNRFDRAFLDLQDDHLFALELDSGNRGQYCWIGVLLDGIGERFQGIDSDLHSDDSLFWQETYQDDPAGGVGKSSRCFNDLS
jgi:hypothetical protein